MTASVPFDRAADFYDVTRAFPPGVEAHAAAAIAAAGRLDAASHVLELGIGTGRVALPLSRHVGKIDGVDLSAPMLRRLRTKQTDHAVRVVQGDVTRLPHRGDAFDAVLAVHVFHLVGDYRSALAEAARVLRPGGRLIHAFSDNERSSLLDQVWTQVTGSGRGADVGMPWSKRKTVAEDEGWLPEGEAVVDYEIRRSPALFIQQARDRCWSSTWRMSDEALEAGIAGLEAYIAAQQIAREAEEVIPARFVVRAYLPPNG